MANDKNQNIPTQQNVATGNDGHGRIHNNQDPAFDKQDSGNDISNVDQQEGAMNNGETGGSLTQNENGK